MNKLIKWAPLLVLGLALTIIILDTTILNVTLRTIIVDLHTDIQSIQWVITAYALMLAAFTITGGRLGDLFGRKKMFVLGAIIFAVGSFMTSIARTVGFMILGEAIIEGMGAALMIPATASLLRSTYRGRDLSMAFGIGTGYWWMVYDLL
jgi:MFS family permease